MIYIMSLLVPVYLLCLDPDRTAAASFPRASPGMGDAIGPCSILYFSTQLDMAQLVRSRTTFPERLAPSLVKSDN